ncbi:effector-associated constant component EACC1 [Streptomyces sp. NBC_00445]|uniref:effector-associated constant component EACC1 n=1 Tax=Streptomyces sp. NBC_00445 TaxID=2975745 RepID=UPI003FCCEBCA
MPDGGPALAELRGFLRDHPRSRRLVINSQRQRDDGSMGTLDVLNVVLTQSAAYGALAVALHDSLRNRRWATGPTTPTLTLTRGDITVQVSGEHSAVAILRLLQSLPEPPAVTDGPDAEPDTDAEPAL